MSPLRMPAASLLVVAIIGIAAPLPASASCTGTPPPAKAIFTGTVTGTDHSGRRATVTTDDGRAVVVIGTPDLAAAATSVDRTYESGARYEFHALNEASPYEDNACTATRQIGPAQPRRWGIAAAAGGVVLALSALAVILVVRRRRSVTQRR